MASSTSTTPSKPKSSSKTPSKTPSKTLKPSENHNPNHPLSTPRRSKPQSPSPKPNPKPPRKFVVARKRADVDPEDRRKAAYDALRASQEGFFQVEVRRSLPEEGCGQVRDLVKAFETLTIPKEKVEFSRETCNRRFSSDSRRSSRGSSRRDSMDSNRSRKLKVTAQQPFKLRTEQRGRLKEENFLKTIKEMVMQEEKMRIPIAQGLPFTTDEPECLVKPPTKEPTEPLDLVLHSDIRAVERADFDQYVASRMTLAEQTKAERERQEMLEEEARMRRLRRELVPKAKPMPRFDRPFIPKKLLKPRTIPKEPKFHMHHSHNRCLSADFGDTMTMFEFREQ